MSTHCDDLSNIIFDVKAKLSDDEYMEMYRLLQKVSESVQPNATVPDSGEEPWGDETTITLPVSMYKAEMLRASSRSSTTGASTCTIQVCVTILGLALMLWG